MWIQSLDYRPPEDAADRLASLPSLAFLDSAMSHAELGRYSYVAADPFKVIRIEKNDPAAPDPAPFGPLRDALAPFRQDTREDAPPFQGGAIGYIAYDFAHRLEHLPRAPRNARICADLRFGLYDTVLAFDQIDRKCWLISTGWPDVDPAARGRRAKIRLKRFTDLLATERGSAPCGDHKPLRWQSNFTRDAYLNAVEAVRTHIKDGDIYQANLSQRFEAALPSEFSPWAMYRRLRRTNPATFGAYLDCGDHHVASSSPERFLRVSGGQVETRPIKGTIRRAVDDPALDEARGRNLLASKKDRAENIMIVDLLRNDLSKACMPDSVEVPALCALETYASVHHLTSQVTGQLAPGKDALDLVTACFPGGSITGAPKIRAMEIITEMEQHARELFCGSIGWVGFDGAMDLNIAIRTVFMNDRTAVLQAGGGITILSDPQSEYDETLAKAGRVFDAFLPEAS